MKLRIPSNEIDNMIGDFSLRLQFSQENCSMISSFIKSRIADNELSIPKGVKHLRMIIKFCFSLYECIFNINTDKAEYSGIIGKTKTEMYNELGFDIQIDHPYKKRKYPDIRLTF